LKEAQHIAVKNHRKISSLLLFLIFVAVAPKGLC